MSEYKEILEFIRLAEELRNKNKDSFIETKGYIKGLLCSQNLKENNSLAKPN